MKNTITLAAVIIGALVSGSAAAATGTVNFIGSVTNVTCNFTPEMGGAFGNTVDLGSYTVSDFSGGTHPVVKTFNLVGKNSNGSACTLTDATNVDITWTPAVGKWGNEGLFNTGSAKNVEVKLMDESNNVISANSQTVKYTGKTEAILPFKAQLVQVGTAAPEAGTVTASASFAVAYK